MKNKMVYLAVFCFTLSQCGCATVLMRREMAKETQSTLYPATQGDAMMISTALSKQGLFGNGPSCIWAGFTLFDFPISLVTDTLILPYDLVKRHEYRKTHPQSLKKTEQSQQKDRTAPTTGPTVPSEAGASDVQ